MKNTIKKIVCFVSAGLAAAAVFTGCGGKKAFDASKNISVVAREDGSGTKSAFMEIIGLKGKADVSGVIIATGTAGAACRGKEQSSCGGLREPRLRYRRRKDA